MQINKKRLIVGKNSVLDALANNENIEELFLSKNVFIKTEIKKTILTNKELNEISNLNHQGYIAKLSSYQYYPVEKMIKDRPKIILILDHIEDAHNLGAIIRSANAFNLNYIIIPDKRAAGISPGVYKSASGGLSNIKIIQTNSISSLIIKLKKMNYWIYCSMLNSDAKNLANTKFNFPLALILGNENKGVSKTLQNLSDEMIFIKTLGSVQSLNVSCAASIFFYKIQTQK